MRLRIWMDVIVIGGLVALTYFLEGYCLIGWWVALILYAWFKDEIRVTIEQIMKGK